MPPRRRPSRASARGSSTRSGPYVVAVKPQTAFFEALGSDGVRALEEVCDYARSTGLLVLLDAKRGRHRLHRARVRGRVPRAARRRRPARRRDDREPVPRARLGRAVPRRLPAARGRVFFLVRTSNAGAADVRTSPSRTDGRCGSTSPSSCTSGASRSSASAGLSSVGAVVGATHPRAVSEARRLLPQSPILLPGVGAQGATPADVARAFTSGPASALVTASRSVIYAFRDSEDDWRCGGRGRGAAPLVAGLGGRGLVTGTRSRRSAGSPPVQSPPVMRRALLAVVALAVAFAAPVSASRRRARVDAGSPRSTPRPGTSSGEDGAVLAEHRARERRAIASITKLMTAVVALERASLSDVVTVSPRAAAVGGSTAFLRAGEQLTVADLVRAMLDPERERRGAGAGPPRGRGLDGALRRGYEREGCASSASADTRFANPHGLDASGHVSSARDATLLVRYALGIPFIRDALERRSVTLAGGREFPTTNDLLTSWPPLVGGKTGHTEDAGWSEAAAARARGATVYGTVLGSASREPERRAAHPPPLRARPLPPVAVVDASRVYASAETGYGRPDVELVAPRHDRAHPARGDGARRARRRPGPSACPCERAPASGRVEVYAAIGWSPPRTSSPRSPSPSPASSARLAWYAETTAENLWGLVS